MSNLEHKYSEFRKSRRSDGSGNCVEVATRLDGGAARVRDSKDQAGPVLTIGREGWAAFIADTKDGRFDLG